jgi:protease-4
VYSGDQAKAVGLVDQLGYMNDAIGLAKTKSGASRVRVVMYDRPWGHKANAYASAEPPQINMVNVSAPDLMSLAQPQILYLWTGRSGE